MVLPVIISMTIDEWITITGQGQALNFSVGVPGPSTLTTQIDPQSGYDYILFHALQFDGITPGTVAFQLSGGMNSTIAGFAVQQFIQSELYITDRGLPLKITIVNSSVAPIVVNLDYIMISAARWERDILPQLTAKFPGGR